MNISLLLEMSADVLADRVAVVAGDDRLTYAELQAAAGAAAARVAAAGVDDLALVDENSTAVPVALFGAALAGKPFAPVNYRLATSRLRELVERLAPTLVV
ncbi:MAG: AMP-binding protein, partial [Acidimicrobiia bacterium]